MEAFKALLASDLVENIVLANPELAEIVRVVREKLDNPTSTTFMPDEDDDDSDSEREHPRSQPHSPTYLSPITDRECADLEVLSQNKKSGEPQFTRVARTLVF